MVRADRRATNALDKGCGHRRLYRAYCTPCEIIIIIVRAAPVWEAGVSHNNIYERYNGIVSATAARRNRSAGAVCIIYRVIDLSAIRRRRRAVSNHHYRYTRGPCSNCSAVAGLRYAVSIL